jgi:aminoglycoside phosphotransferase (APT) family kinase protein
VTAVVDREWAHFGDPMEDVGNMQLLGLLVARWNQCRLARLD